MAKLPQAFTADGEEMSDFTAMPAGKDNFIFSDSEIVLTKAAKEAKDPSLGQMMKLQAKVISGKYKGRIIFVQLNIVNQNETAQEIAHKEFTSICKACKLDVVEDTNELHGIPFTGTFKVESDPNGKYPDKNVFTKYEQYDDTASVGGAEESKSTGKKGGGKKKKSPWAK